MSLSPLIQLGILFGIVLLLVVALLAWFIYNRGERIKGPAKEIQAMTADAKVGNDERPSSVIAEQIEEMVKQKLAVYPDLASMVLDFGTMPDGTMDVWVNKCQYDDIKDIPDERIRTAIQEAVKKFNVGK